MAPLPSNEEVRITLPATLKKRTATTTAVTISRKWARIRRERAITGGAHRKAITAISHITLPIVNCRRHPAIVRPFRERSSRTDLEDPHIPYCCRCVSRREDFLRQVTWSARDAA